MKKTISKYAGVFTLCWAFLILLLCAVPGQYLPESGWMALLGFDKLVHTALFFVLGFLIIAFSSHRRLSWSALLLLFFSAICYGALLEVLQASVFSGRSFERYDVVANAAGLVLALLLSRRLRRCFAP